jgi:hypothetical protein
MTKLIQVFLEIFRRNPMESAVEKLLHPEPFAKCSVGEE